MRNFVVGAFAVALLFGVGPAVYAQTAASGQSKGASTEAFDPHDLTGVIWGGAKAGNMTKEEPPMSAWGLARYKMARTNQSTPPAIGADDNDPVLRCEPPGFPRLLNGFAHPITFMQDPDKIVIIYEATRTFRIVWMKRAHPEHSDILWYGDSTGKWDGNTLVVDTIDFNDRTWLDWSGHPHSDKFHLTERYTRVDHDHLHLEMTVDDPIAYTKTWTAENNWKLEKGWEIAEDVCSPSDEEAVIQQIMTPEAKPAAAK